MSTASIQILLNANGNLGSALDAASGKVLKIGQAAKGAGAAVAAETRTAAGSVAAMGEQTAKAFGTAGSALAKFAGPLGAIGGTAAVAGLAISKALELAREKFTALIEEPVKFTQELQKATAAAEALAKARDAAILGNVGKMAPTAEQLVAQGGPQALALARRISVDSGVDFKEAATAVSAGLGGGMGDDAIRRMVEGAQLADRTGRMPFADAIKAGVGAGVGPGMSAAEAASAMVNHAARQAWVAADPEAAKTSSFATAAGTSPQDFARAQAALAADPIASAAAAQRRAEAAKADRALADVATEGSRVVTLDAMAATAERRNPGLQKVLDEDAKLAADEATARKRAESWSFLGPWNPHWNDVDRIADERVRKSSAYFAANPGGGRDELETVDEFQARITAEKDRAEQTRREAGLPFGAGISKLESLLEEIARNTAQSSPVPLSEAQ